MCTVKKIFERLKFLKQFQDLETGAQTNVQNKIQNKNKD